MWCVDLFKVSVDVLCSLEVSFLKIGSGDANNFPLLQYAATKKIPLVVSTGEWHNHKEDSFVYEIFTCLGYNILLLGDWGPTFWDSFWFHLQASRSCRLYSPWIWDRERSPSNVSLCPRRMKTLTPSQKEPERWQFSLCVYDVFIR